MDKINNNKVIDMSHAFDDSSSHTMSEGEKSQQSAWSSQASRPKIVEWFIKYSGGYIKNEQQAGYVLVGFVVVAIVVSLFLVFSGNKPVGNPKDIKVLPAVF